MNNNGRKNDKDGINQTKQQKRSKRQKNKTKQEPTPPATLSESITFALDDENAFPTLGQEVSASEQKKSDTPKDNGKTHS